MSDKSSDSDESILNTPPKKKIRKNFPSIHRVQKFRFAWQSKKNYGKWLMPHPDDQTKAICTICNKKSIKADIGVIDKHAESLSHSKKMESVQSESLKKFIDISKEKSSMSSLTKRAEIKMCAFMVEHNLPFNIMDHFIDLLKDCYPEKHFKKYN